MKCIPLALKELLLEDLFLEDKPFNVTGCITETPNRVDVLLGTLKVLGPKKGSPAIQNIADQSINSSTVCQDCQLGKFIVDCFRHPIHNSLELLCIYLYGTCHSLTTDSLRNSRRLSIFLAANC